MDSRYPIIEKMIHEVESKLSIKIEGLEKCKDYENLSDWLIALYSDGFTYSEEECKVINAFTHECVEKYDIHFATSEPIPDNLTK